MSSFFDLGILEGHNYTYTWKLKSSDISQCKKFGDVIVSDCIITKGSEKVEWRLNLYPRDVNENDQGYIFLYIGNYSEMEAEVRFSSCAYLNKKILGCYDTNDFVKVSPQKVTGEVTFLKRSDIMDDKDNFLMSDSLTIEFDLCIPHNSKHSSLGTVNRSEEKFRLKEFDDLEKLLENEDYSDVIFCFDNKVLHGHKSILSIKSPVFEAMFKHNMEEKTTNKVKIIDIDYNVFREMLRFLYTGKVRDIENIAQDLFKSADKYCLDSLKTICEKALIDNLTIETALDILKFADHHNSQEMRKQVVDFILINASKILDYNSEKHLSENVSLNVLIDILKHIKL